MILMWMILFHILKHPRGLELDFTHNNHFVIHIQDQNFNHLSNCVRQGNTHNTYILKCNILLRDLHVHARYWHQLITILVNISYQYTHIYIPIIAVVFHHYTHYPCKQHQNGNDQKIMCRVKPHATECIFKNEIPTNILIFSGKNHQILRKKIFKNWLL